MAKVIIFGVNDFAILANFYLKHDSQHQVVAFSVHHDFIGKLNVLEGLPIYPFEEIEKKLDPGEYSFFAPMSYRKMNRSRAKIYQAIKAKGYKLISYVSSKAIMSPDIKMGDNCFILEKNIIQPFVTIGSNVMIWSGSQISHHTNVDDHVFIASEVVISGHCKIETLSFLGMNSSIREGVTVRKGSLVAMGAAIIKETCPWGVYKGIPARRGSASSKDFEV